MWKSKSRQRQIHCTNKCGIKQNIGPAIGHRLAQAHTYIYICIGGFYGAVQLCVHFLLDRERESTFGWRYWKTANIFVPGQQLLLSLLASNKIDWNLFQFECNDETTKQSRAEQNRAEKSRAKRNKTETCYMVRIETISNVLKLILFSCPAAICRRNKLWEGRVLYHI